MKKERIKDFVQELSFLAIITDKNGEKLYFSTGDNEIYYDKFKAENCLDFQELHNSVATSRDRKIEITISKEISVDLFNASIKIILLDGTDLSTQETIIEGQIINHVKSDVKETLIIQPKYTRLNRPIGEFFSEFCRAQLGDKKCNIDLSKFTYTGTIENVINQCTIQGNHKSPKGDFFINGLIVFMDAKTKKKFKSRIVNQSGSVIYMMMKPPHPMQIGDSYEVIAGCDKRLFTCRDKFKNTEFFRGEPFLNGKLLKSITKPVDMHQDDKK